MSTASAGKWVQFFNTAGIPSPAAASYAHIFVENRIQSDMLMDLNKEYLREMGIQPMGDVIAILRHAKHVNDQTARDKVLSTSDLKSSVILTEKPITKSAITIPSHRQRKNSIELKISKSNDSSKKKEALHTGSQLSKKTGIFDRLERNVVVLDNISDLERLQKRMRDDKNDIIQSEEVHTTSEQSVRIIGLAGNASSTSSIFARLGEKSNETKLRPILKTSPSTKKLSSITKLKPMKPSQQKVMFVKKIPAKALTMVADEYELPQRMETGEKTVSFSEEDEVVEIAPRPIKFKGKQKNIKNRLGISDYDKYHKTVKSVKLKQISPSKKNQPIKTIRMKSDEILSGGNNQSVRFRLGGNSKPTSSSSFSSNKNSSMTKLANRIGRVSLSSNSTSTSSAKTNKNGSTSVFDRLGFGR